MAKSSGRLTKRIVEGWNFESDPILWDGQLTGFGVRGGARGKAYFINYKNKYGKERRYTIAKHGGKITVDLARTKAENLLARIKLEKFDPLESRQADRTALTIDDLLDLYLESAKFDEKAETTQYTDRGRINRHLRPTLGKLKLDQLTPDKVRKARADIRDGKTSTIEKTGPRGKAVVRGGDGAARMAIRVFRAILSWAVNEGLLPDNPARGIELGADGKRDAILETPEQYAALFRALDKLEKFREIPSAAADAIRLLAFTGARRGEIAALKWSYVDLKKGILTLPAKAHKSGHGSNKSKEIALPSAAQAIISQRPTGGPDDYVFPSAKGDTPVTLSAKLWQRIREEAGLPDGISNHSLRHSLGTLMAMQGAQGPEIMAALGHSQISTTERYIHATRDARTKLADKHTATIAGAFTTAPVKQPTKITG